VVVLREAYFYLGQSIKSEKKDLLEAFIHEVLAYRKPMILALKEILGDQDSQNVMRDLAALEEKGGIFLIQKSPDNWELFL